MKNNQIFINNEYILQQQGFNHSSSVIITNDWSKVTVEDDKIHSCCHT